VSDWPRSYGPYVLLKSLGTGSTGDVCLARPKTQNRSLPPLLVIKRLHGQLSAQGDFLKRFRHEGEIAVLIDNPHVARVFDVGRVGESFYIALEYIAGWPLGRVIIDLKRAGHRPSITSVCEIMSGALAGLSALHTAKDKDGKALRIVHRDIAPKNIMVGEDGRTRLIDLGLGKSNVQDWKTGTGIVMGTPGYMAPEQVTGRDVDARTDTYAMGIVLWELLTLKRFIDRGPVPVMLRAQVRPDFRRPSEMNPEVPAGLEAVCHQALAPDAENRFATAEAFRTALLDASGLGSGPPATPTLVGDLLWGELNQAKTEVTALLQNPMARTERVPQTQGSFEVLAARPESAMPPPQLEWVNAQPMGTPTPLLYTPTMGVPAPTPAPAGVPLKVVLGLMLFTLALGVSVGALLLQQQRSEQVVLSTVPSKPPPMPQAAAAPVAEAAPTPEPKPARIVRTRTPTRRAGTAPARVPTQEAPRALPLLRQVIALRARLPADSPQTQTTNRLVLALQAEVSASSPSTARLQELAAQVRRLKSALP
jgi:serine/threonine protein kinase